MMGVDNDFRRQVMDINIKASLQFCYQCNRCTTECPISINKNSAAPVQRQAGADRVRQAEPH